MTGCGGWRNGLLGLIEGTRWRILQRPAGGHAHHVNIEMGRRRWDLIEVWLWVASIYDIKMFRTEASLLVSSRISALCWQNVARTSSCLQFHVPSFWVAISPRSYFFPTSWQSQLSWKSGLCLSVITCASVYWMNFQVAPSHRAKQTGQWRL